MRRVATDFDALTIRPQGRKKRDRIGRKPVVGWDTETRPDTGDLFLVCASDGLHAGDGSWRGRPTTWFDVEELMFRHQYRETINVFWNLRFDFTAIVKFLPEDRLKQLHMIHTTEIGDLTIKLVPWKMFILSKPKEKHSVSFFDVFQFYNMSLDAAASRYIGDRKAGIDVERFRSPRWLDRHCDEVLRYCERDADLTAQLGARMQAAFNDKLGVPFTRPISPAYLSGVYFAKTSYIPQAYKIPRPALRAYYDAYHGGRFEVSKRGRFEDAYLYDLTSAYPWEMTRLIDPTKGSWVRSRRVLWDAALGAVKARVELDQRGLNPLAYTYEPQLFPWGKWTATFTLSELDFIRENGLGRIRPGVGWYFYPDAHYQPFRKMLDLFRLREEYKKAGDRWEVVVKLCMNSLYGKTWEVVQRMRKTTEADDDWVYSYREPDGPWHYYKEANETGRFWNPVFAAEITAGTRLRLATMTLDHPVLGMATDSVFSEERIPNKTLRVFGRWEERAHGDLLMLGSGRYTMRAEDEAFTKNRGFESKLDLIDLLERNPRKRKIVIPTMRPVTLHEALTRRDDELGFLDLMNAFVRRDLTLDLNFDRKRIWERDFKSGRDALCNVIDSVAPRVA